MDKTSRPVRFRRLPPITLAEAVTDQLRNNGRLGAQGMQTPPGLRLGHLDRGVTVVALGPDDGTDDVADAATLSRIESSACDQ